MAPADVQQPNMSDPFASFGAPPQQGQQNGYDDPWASMNQQPPHGSPQGMPPAPQQVPLTDPWGNMNQSAPSMPPQELPSMPPQAPPSMPPAPPTEDPWASMNTQAPPPALPPQAPQQQPGDPWAMGAAPAPPVPSEQPTVQPIVNMMQPPPQMPPQQPPQPQGAVPTTIQINGAGGYPPSPIGDLSVVAQSEKGPIAPVLGQQVQGRQVLMQQNQQAMMQGQGMMNGHHYQQGMHNVEGMMNDQQMTMQNGGNPFGVAEPNGIMQQQEQSAMQQPPANPFEGDLAGQMKNLSMNQGGGIAMMYNGAPAPSGMAPMSPVEQNASNGMPISNGAPCMSPVEQVVPNVMTFMAPLMPPNGMAPPPACQPPTEPTMTQQPMNGSINLSMNPNMQAPLSPDDNPFAIHSPVVSPGVPLSPQVNDLFGYAFSPMTSPTETQHRASLSPVMPGAVPDMPNLNASTGSNNTDPFGVFGSQQSQAMVPSTAVNDDPFGVFGSSAAPNNSASSDPFGASMLDNSGGAMVLSNQLVDDPFGIFGAPTPVQQQPTSNPPVQSINQQAPTQQAGPWSFAESSSEFQAMGQSSLLSVGNSDEESEAPIELDTNGLPKQGDYYEARVSARSLGAMFYTARDLEDTLLYHMPTNVIDSLKTRPVVAYVAEDSAAFNSGIHLGHCILQVNGIEVADPDKCADVIRHASRPMNIRAYVMPELEVTLAEGKHMVKYDSREIGAPASELEWKAKYVVVGGIVAKPWVINMYRSKKEFDTAVKETHSNYKCSVKVKQFDLRGARIVLRSKDGKPNTVNYHGVWHYFTIVPQKGYPIKISSENLDDLEPVYAAVRRFVRKDMEQRSHGYAWK